MCKLSEWRCSCESRHNSSFFPSYTVYTRLSFSILLFVNSVSGAADLCKRVGSFFTKWGTVYPAPRYFSLNNNENAVNHRVLKDYGMARYSFRCNGNRIVDCRLRVLLILLIRPHPRRLCVPFPQHCFKEPPLRLMWDELYPPPRIHHNLGKCMLKLCQ